MMRLKLLKQNSLDTRPNVLKTEIIVVKEKIEETYDQNYLENHSRSKMIDFKTVQIFN